MPGSPDGLHPVPEPLPLCLQCSQGISTAEYRPRGEGSHHKTHLSKEESEVRKGEAQEMVPTVHEAVKAGC